jgi:sugar lactone lactonase YvrE
LVPILIYIEENTSPPPDFILRSPTGSLWSAMPFLTLFFSSIYSSLLVISGVISVVVGSSDAHAQAVSGNPYQVIYHWGELPDGRTMGVVTGVHPDPDGEHMWIVERCSTNQCAGSNLAPIHKLDSQGRVVKSIGAGLFAWPHGFDLDSEGNIWVTEGAPAGDARGRDGFALGMGHQVLKLNQDGEVLMRLGEAGVAGDDATHFNGPSAVQVADDGAIWIADGHRGGNNRVLKFSAQGELILQLGGGIDSLSREVARFNDPHDLKMDSEGRLFVADRGNNRIQIFDSEGELLSIWTQFGRPSGIWIDAQDRIYVADGMSGDQWNPGWQRGIRIGDARTSWITDFIPDYEVQNGSGIEFLATDAEGNIYAGQVGRQRFEKYVRVRP